MMREFELKNGIKSVYKNNKETPRIALTMNIAINTEEKHAGTYSLMTRLLLQGTKKYNNEELAKILDENGIELITDMKQDYLRFRLLCLNEDFPKAIELLEDVIKNSTFDEFEKEKVKMQGELVAELDSARLKVSDAFIKTIYENHYYGHTYTNILESLDKITKEDVITSYKKILESGKKVIAVVGSLDDEYVINLLEKHLDNLPNTNDIKKSYPRPTLTSQKTTKVLKEDAQQAQILQGWLIPAYKEEDYPVMLTINTILGASGLSSRLFRELREKRGLAYTVRTSCEVRELSAVFSIYIATEPSNIDTCLKGFKEEIDKLKTELVSEEELQNAKNNIDGKHQFVVETNFQQSTSMAYYGISDLPFDYYETMHEKIKNVTPYQVKECANKYFTDNNVVAILHPNMNN